MSKIVNIFELYWACRILFSKLIESRTKFVINSQSSFYSISYDWCYCRFSLLWMRFDDIKFVIMINIVVYYDSNVVLFFNQNIVEALRHTKNFAFSFNCFEDHDFIFFITHDVEKVDFVKNKLFVFIWAFNSYCIISRFDVQLHDDNNVVMNVWINCIDWRELQLL